MESTLHPTKGSTAFGAGGWDGPSSARTHNTATRQNDGADASDPSATSFLRFGDVIVLYLDTEDLEGYLMADGFSDEQCGVLAEAKDGFGRREMGALPDPVSMTDNLFQLVTKQVYTSQKKLKRKLQKATEEMRDEPGGGKGGGGKISGRLDNLPPEDLQEVERLVQEVTTEKQQNAYEAQRLMGTQVCYGQVVQLLHVKSHKFLTVRPKEVAELESNCQKVLVQAGGSHESWWTIEPRYKIQHAGEAVRYLDSVSLASEKLLGQRLRCSAMPALDPALEGDGDRDRDGAQSKVSVHEVNAKPEKTTWKLRLYTPWARGMATCVQGGDIVQLLHAEAEALLCFQESGPIYFRSLDAEQRDKESARKTAVNPFCMWRLELEKTGDGGSVEFGSICRLRHVVTDKYIALKRHADEVLAVPVSAEGELGGGGQAALNLPTMLEAEGVDSAKTGRIPWESLLYLKGHKSGGYLHAEVRERAGLQRRLKCLQKSATQDGFRLLPVDASMVSDVHQVESAKRSLSAFLRVLRQQDIGRAPVQSKFNHKSISALLAGLVAFCGGAGHSSRSNTDDVLMLNRVVGGSSKTGGREDGGGRGESRGGQVSGGGAAAPDGVDHVMMAEEQARVRRVRQDLVRQLGVLDKLVELTKVVHKRCKALAQESEGIIISMSPRDPVAAALQTSNAVGSRTHRDSVASTFGVAADNRNSVGFRKSPRFSGGTAGGEPRGAEVQTCIKLFAVTHQALQAAIAGRPESGTRLLQDVKALQEQMKTGRLLAEHAAKTLSVMFRENQALKEQIEMGRVDFLLSLIDSDPAQRTLYIDLLALLLCDGDTGIKRIQDHVVERWLQNRRLKQLIINTVSPDGGIVQLAVHPEPDHGARGRGNPMSKSRKVDLEVLTVSATANSLESKDKELYALYLSNLRLLDALCKGCNNDARTLIKSGDKDKRIMTFDALLQCVANERLPARLRSVHMQLMLHLFVQRPRTHHVQPLRTTFLHSELAHVRSDVELFPEMALESDLQSDPKKGHDLKREVIETLSQSTSSLVPEAQDGHNDLVLSATQLCHELLRCGYFSLTGKQSLKELLMPLVSILDGSSDSVVLPPSRSPGPGQLHRYIRTEETEAIMQTKLEVCHMLAFICDLRLTHRLQRAVALFDDFHTALHLDAGHGSPVRGHSFSRIHVFAHSFLAPMPTQDLRDFLQEKEKYLHDDVLSFLNFASQSHGGDRLSTVLLDLLRYQHLDLAQAAMGLLFRERAPKLELYIHLHDIQLLLGAEEERDFKQAQGWVQSIREVAVGAVVMMQSVNVDKHALPPDKQRRLVDCIQNCATLCQSQGNPGRAWVNKELMRRGGVHEVVLDLLVAFHHRPGDAEGNKDVHQWILRGVLPTCLAFLEHFCSNMYLNQEQVVPHARCVLSCIHHGVHIAGVLSAMYHHHWSLCSSIDPLVIDTIVYHIAGVREAALEEEALQDRDGQSAVMSRTASAGESVLLSSQAVKRSEGKHAPTVLRRDETYIRLLEGLCQVQNKNIRHNQSYILNSLCEHGPLYLKDEYRTAEERTMHSRFLHDDGEKEEAVMVLFRGTTGKEKRAGLVKSGDPQGLLRYYVSVLSLLRTLSQAHSPDDRSRVTILLRPQAIYDDVVDPLCPLPAKEHLLAIFLATYVQGGPRVGHRSVQMVVWQLLEHLRALLTKVDMEGLRSCATTSGWSAVWAAETDGWVADSPEDELCRLLFKCWVPLLLNVIDDKVLLNNISVSQGKVTERIVRRLLDVQGSCPTPDDIASSVAQAVNLARKRHIVDLERIRLPSPSSHNEESVESSLAGFLRPGDDLQPVATRHLEQKLQVFAAGLLDQVDRPISSDETTDGQEETREEQIALEEEGDEEEMDDHEERIRHEFLDMCHAFITQATAIDMSSRRSRSVGVFNADKARFLVNLLSSYHANNIVECEKDLFIGCRVLRHIANMWRGSATELRPPSWLLDGVPRLVVQLISDRRSSDNVVLACLELGIEVLHGGNQDVQQSFLSILTAPGAPTTSFFHMLQLRMKKAEREAYKNKQLLTDLAKGGSAPYDDAPEIISQFVQQDGMPNTPSHFPGAIGDKSMHSLLAKMVSHRGVMADSHSDLVFRFLHLLCEGHNLKLQNFLRHQPQSMQPVDMVSAVAAYIVEVTPHVSPLSVHTLGTALLALAEFVQSPCRPNQRVLVDTSLCSCCNTILNLGQEIPRSLKPAAAPEFLMNLIEAYSTNINRLKAAAINVLLSLLECVDEPYIPERMLETLEHGRLRENMNNLLKIYNNKLYMKRAPESERQDDHMVSPYSSLSLRNQYRSAMTVNKEPTEEELEEAAAEAQEVAEYYYITYITLAAFDTSGELKAHCNEQHIWDYKNLREKVGVIEISRNGVLEQAYFVIPPVCQYLTQQSRHQLLISVNRANLQTQLTGFAESLDTLYEEMKHQQKLTENVVLNFFRMTLQWREKVFFYNAILINFLILMFYSYECNGTFVCGDNEDLVKYRLKPGWKELVRVLAAIQCLFAITRQWWYVVERGIPMVNQRVQAHSKRPPTGRLFAWMVRLPQHQADPTYRHVQGLGGGTGIERFGLSRLTVVKVIYMLNDLRFWGITVMTVVNLLALFVNSEGSNLFLLVHLLEIFNHSRVLQNVMRSITYRGNTLLQTAGLALVMIYFFGVVGFILFPELFQFAEADIVGGRKLEPNNNGARCTSIWKCTLVVLDMGIRKEDLGEAMDDIPWKVDTSDADQYRIFYRMLYTLLFFIIVSTILMNIIFGVIIDTFAELRAKKDEIDRDISGKCFICGIERFEFDQLGESGSGFEDHIRNDHNMWKYLFFQVYLREQDYDDYSGGESYVFSKTLQLVQHPHTHETIKDIDTGRQLKAAKPQIDLSWLPQRSAMVLKNQRSSNDEKLNERLRQLEASSTTLTARLHARLDKLLVFASNPAHDNPE